MEYLTEEETAEEMKELVNYCEECDRYYDSRSGCEADIRKDERHRLYSMFAFIVFVLLVSGGLVAAIYWRIS